MQKQEPVEVLPAKSSLRRTVERLDRIVEQVLEESAQSAEERVTLAAKVSQVAARMEAFGEVLEDVGARKQSLEERLKKVATPAMKRLLEKQLQFLSEQEDEVLRRAGAGAGVKGNVTGQIAHSQQV